MESDSSEEIDTTISENSSIIKKEEDTLIIKKESREDSIKRLTPIIEENIKNMVENIKVGKYKEFIEAMKFLIISCFEMKLEVSNLENQLEEIREQFYRNELSDEDFEEILMLDEEEY